MVPPAPAFAPSDVSGLKQWLEDDVGNVVKDGSGFVSQWTDLSGTGLHGIQATGSKQPLWSALGIVCDGVDDELNFTPVALTAYTVFIIYKITSLTAGGYGGPYSWRVGGTAGFALSGENGPPTGPYRSNHYKWSGAAESTYRKATTSYTLPMSSLVLHSWSSTPDMYIRGVDDSVTVSSTTGYANCAAIGKSYITFVGGVYRAVLVYDSVISTVNRQSIEAYLENKYSL